MEHTIVINAKGNAEGKLDTLNAKLERVKSNKNISPDFAKMSKGASGATAAITKLGAAIAGIGLVSKGLQVGFDSIKDSFSVFAERENLLNSLGTLLGSDNKAKAKMKELVELGASTPLTLNEIANSYRQLLSATDEEFATVKLLTLIGDAAKSTNNDLDQVTRHYSRMFAAIRRGGAFGTELQELASLGIIKSSDFAKLSQISSGKIKVEQDEAMSLALKTLDPYSGGMLKASQSLDGKLSTLEDTVDALKYQFAEGLAPALKSAIDGLTRFTATFIEPQLDYKTFTQDEQKALDDDMAKTFNDVRQYGKMPSMDAIAQEVADSIAKADADAIARGWEKHGANMLSSALAKGAKMLYDVNGGSLKPNHTRVKPLLDSTGGIDPAQYKQGVSNATSQAMQAIISSIALTGSQGAGIGNGYGNMLNANDIVKSVQQQTLNVNQQQLSVQTLILTELKKLDKNTNNIALFA